LSLDDLKPLHKPKNTEVTAQLDLSEEIALR